jgi:methylmalonyl-CoA carboxyltransferase 12S subunit
MKPDKTDGAHLTEIFEDLRLELKRLGERVAALETAAATKPSAVAQAPDEAHPLTSEIAAGPDGLDEELVLVISAAIAAFLGKKPHIRQIHVLNHAAWAQQGRVTIQASHRLAGAHH